MENASNKVYDKSIIALLAKRFLGFCTVIMLFYKKSFYQKTFSRLIKFFSNAYRASNMYKVFTSDKNEDLWLEKSYIYRWISKAYNAFDALLVKFGTYIVSVSDSSIVASSIIFMKNNSFKISIKYYGVALAVFGIFKIAVDIFFNHQVLKMQLFEALLVVVGLLMMFINCSLIELYNGSSIRRLVGLQDIKADFVQTEADKSFAWAIAVGALIGLTTIISAWKTILIGAIGAFAVLAMPIIGVFVATVLFPFLGTMKLVGILLLTLVGVVLGRAFGTRQKLGINLFELCLLIVGSSFIFGVINSYAPKSSFKIALVYLVFVLSFSLIRRLIDSKKAFFVLIDMLLLALTAVSTYGLYQKLSGSIEKTAWLDATMFGDLGGRVYSTFANPNVFGEYLLLTMPLCLARLYYAKSAIEKFFYSGLLAISGVCMVLTMSRGCWIGILVALVIFVIYKAKKLIPVAFVGVLFVPMFLSEKIINRFLSIGNMADSSTSYRVFIWEGTIRMLREFWFTGVGLGTDAYNVVYPLFSYSSIVAPHPHSLYMLIFTETGLLGFIAIIPLIVMFFRRLSVAALAGGKYKALAVAIGGGIAGFLIQGSFDNVWYNYRMFMFFFMFLALADVLARIASVQGEGGKSIEEN